MRVEFIATEEFHILASDLENEIFVVCVTSLAIFDGVYFFRKAQKVSLKVDGAPITVLPEYSNFADVFSPELAIELPEYMRINNYAINLVNNK